MFSFNTSKPGILKYEPKARFNGSSKAISKAQVKAGSLKGIYKLEKGIK